LTTLNLGDITKLSTNDFKGVKTIGQAFADEVFRVWQNHHQNIEIIYKNADKNVLFMIKKALSVNK